MSANYIKQDSRNAAPDFNQLEEEVLRYWEENNIPQKSLAQNQGKEPYVFYDGPPFATGLPHHGHILASAIKDAIPRYQSMKGKHVRRRWGWDCHGLPIENIVEQHLKISGKKQIETIGVERFNRVCRENVLEFAHEWGKMVRRMARWIEFDNAYKTMDTTYMESVWWALKQIWDKGLIYEDRKVLLYCSRCETPISNFEVAMDNSYRDVTEESVYVKFRLLPGQRILDFITTEKTFVLAWTTTPWTLPGNTALNVGPEIFYVLVEAGGEFYVLAKDRLNVLSGEYEVKLEFSSRALEGLSYEPLFAGVIANPDKTAHKIYSENFVTTEDGTGVVHNAAMYGEEDYEAAKRRNLPRELMLDHKGQYLDILPEFLRGVYFKDADKMIIAELQTIGLLYKTESYTHSYPHCWRCGTPLFYSALPAWFINIQTIKPRLLELNQDINWYPAHLKLGRFGKGVENAPDWNISRNRYWATPLPFWKCDSADCKRVTCVGSIQELIEKSTNFAEVYPQAEDLRFKIKDLSSDDLNLSTDNFNLESLDLHKPYIDRIKLKCEKCAGSMSRIPEVVDCWVESGSMPFAELHYPFEHNAESRGTGDATRNHAEPKPDDFQSRFPAQFVAEYIAQTRAWFYVMHVMSALLFNRAPFENVVTTGNILTESGEKMSKSKRNFLDPWPLIGRYGTDAIRLYLLGSPAMDGDDINFSERSLAEVYRKSSLVLYNVLGFYKTYAAKSFTRLPEKISSELDIWVLARLHETVMAVTRALDKYSTPRAARTLIGFISDLSTWYLRRSRERIKAGGQAAADTEAVLGFVLRELSKLLAPFMPFLAEHIFRAVTAQESVHLESWPEALAEFSNPRILEQMQGLRQLVELGLALRKGQNLKVRQPLAELNYAIAEGKPKLTQSLESILAEELNVKTVTEVEKLAAEANWSSKTSAEFSLALYTALDEALKTEGLARELERQIQDLRKKGGLKVGELADVYYNTQNTELESALVNLVDRKKTFVSQINKSLEVEADFEGQAEIGGAVVWLGLVKI